MTSTLIIGAGFCAQEFLQVIPNSFCTELPALATGKQIPFDINDENTWSHLPDFAQCIVTCKMTHENKSAKFAKLLHGKKTVVLSSAKCFKNVIADGEIDENSPLNDNVRNSSEAHFLPFAAVLHLGLIWGPGREADRWIKEGRIKNGRKLVNFIHVKDLAKIVSHILSKDIKAGRYLVSDGRKIRWRDLAGKNQTPLNDRAVGTESKLFVTGKLREYLAYDFKFIDIRSSVGD